MTILESPFNITKNQNRENTRSGGGPGSSLEAGRRFNLNHGFLPATDPIAKLPDLFSPWEELAAQLPKLLATQFLRSRIEELPPLPLNPLTQGDAAERLMMILSYLGHAYVWQAGQEPATRLPHRLAQAWYDVAQLLGRPPVLSYASYALYNWRRIDPHEPIELGNIVLAQNFLGGIDEEWFILVHVDIEHRAIAAMQAIVPAQEAAQAQDQAQLEKELDQISQALAAMIKTLERMPEHCDPYIYYHRVRPYIHGWKANPALPDGLIYDQVAAYQNRPVQFKGETGAQSTIIPVLDAAFGIQHADNPLKAHLLEMREYMPPSHRQFLAAVETGPSIREFIQHANENKLGENKLKAIYNHILEQIHKFRSQHLHYAAHYIQKQHQISTGNPTSIGTGGTPFMEYLRKHEGETLEFLLK